VFVDVAIPMKLSAAEVAMTLDDDDDGDEKQNGDGNSATKDNPVIDGAQIAPSISNESGSTDIPNPSGEHEREHLLA